MTKDELKVQGRLKHSNWTFQNTLEVFLVAGGSQFLQGAPGTGQASYTEAWEPQKRRFEVECEFVQALANPHYLNFLAQRGYFKEEYFVNYLKYLLYWKRPQYARALKYPQCLHFLEAVQSAEFREALSSAHNAKFIEDQQILQWQYYLRKRQRLAHKIDQKASASAVKTEPADK